MNSCDSARVTPVVQAMMKMNQFEITALQRAFNGG